MIEQIIISKDFKRSILKVTLAIVLFFLFYLLLLSISIGLLVLSIIAGGYIITEGLSFVALALGLGVIVLGLMFFLFMIKFVFARFKNDNPYRIQMKKQDCPEFHIMIEDLARKVGTKPPKKVFIRHDVNASVFYNSSFWSLFFPVRKNLDIGLGLINCVNTSELQAILAHEFGHFSQKSMRLGIYVYTVNNVIYNLVNNHDRWDIILERWASVGGIFGFFANITFQLVESVRFLLSKAYNLINKTYMGLSREMEYHADQIAATVAGKDNMVSALRRTEFGSAAFNNTLNGLNLLINENKKSENIFLNHSYEIKRIGELFKLSFNDNLPIITDKSIDLNTIKPRVIFKDQWASHPSREEREKRLELLSESQIEIKDQKIDVFFKDYHLWQTKISHHLYQVDYGKEKNFETVGPDTYVKALEIQQSKFKIDDIFQDFYNNRLIHPVDLKSLNGTKEYSDIKKYLGDIYSKKSKLKFNKLELDRNDLVVLQQIKNKEIDTKHFDFDNVKYHRRDIQKVIDQLDKEITTQQEELEELDKEAFLVNLHIAKETSEAMHNKFAQICEDLCEAHSQFEKHSEFVDKINNYHFVLVNTARWHEEGIRQFNRELSKLENNYKNKLELLNIEDFKDATEEHTKTFKEFINDQLEFIRVTGFDGEKFGNFLNFIYNNHELINDRYLCLVKELTDLQNEMYIKNNLMPE